MRIQNSILNLIQFSNMTYQHHIQCKQRTSILAMWKRSHLEKILNLHKISTYFQKRNIHKVKRRNRRVVFLLIFLPFEVFLKIIPRSSPPLMSGRKYSQKRPPKYSSQRSLDALRSSGGLVLLKSWECFVFTSFCENNL